MQYVVLLDTGFDWPEVVFIGSHEDANRFTLNEVLPKLEGDDEVYYSVTALVSVDAALQHRTDELFDGEPPESVA